MGQHEDGTIFTIEDTFTVYSAVCTKVLGVLTHTFSVVYVVFCGLSNLNPTVLGMVGERRNILVCQSKNRPAGRLAHFEYDRAIFGYIIYHFETSTFHVLLSYCSNELFEKWRL